jgi:transposase
MIFSSREEREEYVIDLYKQGRSIRDIAQEVHMSFSDIGAITRKVTGDNRPKGQAVEASKETQAYKLYMEGKKACRSRHCSKSFQMMSSDFIESIGACNTFTN